MCKVLFDKSQYLAYPYHSPPDVVYCTCFAKRTFDRIDTQVCRELGQWVSRSIPTSNFHRACHSHHKGSATTIRHAFPIPRIILAICHENRVQRPKPRSYKVVRQSLQGQESISRPNSPESTLNIGAVNGPGQLHRGSAGRSLGNSIVPFQFSKKLYRIACESKNFVISQQSN